MVHSGNSSLEYTLYKMQMSWNQWRRSHKNEVLKFTSFKVSIYMQFYTQSLRHGILLKATRCHQPRMLKARNSTAEFNFALSAICRRSMLRPLLTFIVANVRFCNQTFNVAPVSLLHLKRSLPPRLYYNYVYAYRLYNNDIHCCMHKWEFSKRCVVKKLFGQEVDTRSFFPRVKC